jgi:formylglycine-generating enzyme required for sulfatase activity
MSQVVTKRNSRLSDFPQLREYLLAMCQIPSGSFQMGSLTGNKDEQPVHKVTISGFQIGSTPVTVAMWKEYCDNFGKLMPTMPEWGWLDGHPMVNVSWNDIMGADGKGGYCAWASSVAGVNLTLPTEAQFEYAATSAENDYVFSWGNQYDDSKLWCSKVNIRKSTATVKRDYNIHRNRFGLTDMFGNVWQWCFDWYGTYTRLPTSDPVEAISSLEYSRCVRGGSWRDGDPNGFRICYRGRGNPDRAGHYDGFRLAVRTDKNVEILGRL